MGRLQDCREEESGKLLSDARRNLEGLARPPKSLGFDPERLRAANAMLERGIADGLFPAAAYAVLRHGMIAAKGAFGLAQPDASPPVRATFETLFDMASLTKPMTATLLLQCVERGDLHLGQTVGFFLPEAEKTPVAEVTLRQLATHTSGLPPWKPLYKSEKPTPLAEILATPREADPGKRYAYSDLGYILLGEILTRVTKMPLERLAKERLYTPLGMAASGYLPASAARATAAATRFCPWRGEANILLGEVHDANAHKLGGAAGHAGLFSNAPDMIRYILSFRYPATAAHLGLPSVLGPRARHLAERSQIEPSVGSHSIGWFCVPSGYLPQGDLLSSRSFGHTGFTGTSLVFDPETDVTILLLTNRVYSAADGTGVLRLRRLFSNLVAGALTA